MFPSELPLPDFGGAQLGKEFGDAASWAALASPSRQASRAGSPELGLALAKSE